MKLTPQEIDTFKNLGNTELGLFLVSYARRLQDHAYDSRSWGPKDSKETADRVSVILQELFIDKIRAVQPSDNTKGREFE